MLNIDTAIKHCLEVAEQNETQAEKWQEEGGEQWGKTTVCRECAADHRQLAEWLMEYKDLKAEQNDQYVFIHELMSELKKAKQLLKSAIDEWNLVCEWGNCGEYCGWFKNGKCTQEWSNKAEALKLIGGSEMPNDIANNMADTIQQLEKELKDLREENKDWKEEYANLNKISYGFYKELKGAKELLRLAVKQMAEVGDICDCIHSQNCPLDECGKFTFHDEIMKFINN